jgi:hypothetical protein
LAQPAVFAQRLIALRRLQFKILTQRTLESFTYYPLFRVERRQAR